MKAVSPTPLLCTTALPGALSLTRSSLLVGTADLEFQFRWQHFRHDPRSQQAARTCGALRTWRCDNGPIPGRADAAEFAAAHFASCSASRPDVARQLIQRLDLDDRGAVGVADPKRARGFRIVDMHAPDIGPMRQLVFCRL